MKDMATATHGPWRRNTRAGRNTWPTLYSTCTRSTPARSANIPCHGSCSHRWTRCWIGASNLSSQGRCIAQPQCTRRRGWLDVKHPHAGDILFYGRRAGLIEFFARYGNVFYVVLEDLLEGKAEQRGSRQFSRTGVESASAWHSLSEARQPSWFLVEGASVLCLV